MIQFKKLKPVLWDDLEHSASRPDFSFRRKWMIIVVTTSLMVLIPLVLMTLMDFAMTRRIIENEVRHSMTNTLSAISAAVGHSRAMDLPDDIQAWDQALKRLGTDLNKDIFIVDSQGILRTDSYHSGPAGTRFALAHVIESTPAGFTRTRIPEGTQVLLAFHKPANSSITLVQVKDIHQVTGLWLKPRIKLVSYLGVSIGVIILAIMGLATFLLRRIFRANQYLVEALHHEEQANRLASIGRLASGVAHEINNPLAIINQKTGLIQDLLTLEKSTGVDERIPKLTDDVLAAVSRCSAITHQLLDFARHMEPHIEPVDIKEVLGQILPLLQAETEHTGIDVVVDYPQGIPLIECDRSALQQIFLNLGENAITAMGKTGDLTIQVENAWETSDREKSDKDKTHSVDAVQIIISDTGKGIEKQDLKNIFEPFYTTKKEGWGAGLGLAITYGLIKEMGGDIRVKSQVGKGTRFTLTLPVKARLSEEAKAGSLILPKDKNSGSM